MNLCPNSRGRLRVRLLSIDRAVLILDTNVLSAVMEKKRSPAVVAWFDRQSANAVYITAITVYEARFGIERLDPGPLRERLHEGFERAMRMVLAGRILPVDEAAAREAAAITAERQKKGRTVDVRDTLIAGVVRSHKARLATRNTKDFKDAGIKLVDPWKAKKD